ncbi:OpgC family protein [Pseudoruegeria sp. HB172150]|uniref:OpgC family protein n=1 Tax=Pseudoruegeria sp. HB172150 TaxID=2721164 RepID=UPI0015521A80|nr:OpgC domain-containing protein [Pseudoruegeria sp. HB172150]
MQQPDGKLVRFPKAKSHSGRPRDPRIDAFRGLALLMIFIDHMPGNPYEDYTIRNWGFSDAAEAFFVMSGIAAGLAYSGRFLPEARAANGLMPAVAPMWSRAWTLYIVHIFLTFSVIAIFALGAHYFAMPELLEKHNLGLVFEAPEAALPGVIALLHQIGYVNILPVYSVLLLFGPLMILGGLWRPWLVAGLSLAVWFAAGVWRLNIPNAPGTGEWFFDPLSWQFVFVVGLLIGIHMRRDERFVPKNWILFGIAAFTLVFVLAWKYIPEVGDFMNHQMWRLGQLGAPFHIVTHEKAYLAMPRLLHILAMVYVVSCLPVITRACGHKLAEPLRLMGRQGLLVFSAGTLMALSFQVLLAGFSDIEALPWLLPPIGATVLVAVAWLGDWRRRTDAAARASTPAADVQAPAAKRGAVASAS